MREYIGYFDQYFSKQEMETHFLWEATNILEDNKTNNSEKIILIGNLHTVFENRLFELAIDYLS